MRRKVFIYIMLLMAELTMAQTQQGVVKTKGRMVNGKHVKGTALTGAVVSVKGQNAVAVKNADGSFSFPTVNRSFFIQSVTKNGYQLVDADAAPKAYAYSTNPLILLLETPSQQAEDRLAAERKIRRTLQRQLQQREDELEELKAQNKLTHEEYQGRLQQLYDDQNNNEKLIADMAKEYSQIDYDQLDELNRQISDAILNGELTKADSLLRTKGDINSRVAEVRKAQQIEAEREKEIARQQQELSVSQKGTKKKLEDIAQDCKNYFDRYKMSNQHDSAAYYIELRAELDTTNADWQFDAACYYQDQNLFRKAESCYERALQLYRLLSKIDSLTYEPAMAITLNDMANLYSKNQRYEDCELMYKEALEIHMRQLQSNPQDVANTLNNLAILYMNTKRYEESESMYKKALGIMSRRGEDYPIDYYERGLANTLNNLAILYKITKRLEESESMCKKALEILRRLAKEEPLYYEADVANTLNNLASLYSNTQRLDESEAMYKEALEIRRRLAASNPQAYEPDVAHTLNNLANLYQTTQRFDESESMYKEALEIRRRLSASNPQAYEPDVAQTLNSLAILYADTQRLEESEAMYKEALEIRRRLAASNPQAYEPDVAHTLNNLALLYKDIQRFEESEAMYKEALEIYRRLAASNPRAYEPDVAMTLNNLANLYANTQRLKESEAMYRETLEIFRRLAASNPQAYEPDVAHTLKNLAILYADTQRFEESEDMYKEALEMYRLLAASNPQAYEPSVAQIEYCIGYLNVSMEQYSEAIAPFEEALVLYRRLSKTNPAQQQGYSSSLYWLSRLYPTENNYLDAYKTNQEWLPIMKKHYEADMESQRNNFAGCLGNQSYCAIFAKQYAEAELYARKGLAVDSTKHLSYTNLAASLLFQGKYAEAETIYRRYKNELKDGFLDDFNQFAEAGVIPEERKEDVEQIKQMLNEP